MRAILEVLPGMVEHASPREVVLVLGVLTDKLILLRRQEAARERDRPTCLDKLLEEELLAETGRGNSRRYSVTDEGRALWERRATSPVS